MKICIGCKVEKDTTEFGKDKNKTDGLNVYCKLCTNKRAKEWRIENIDHVREYEKRTYDPVKRKVYADRYYKKNRQKESDRMLVVRYGVTKEQLEEMKMVESCPICKSKAVHLTTGRGCKSGRIVIDHAHDTGKVRGYICASCNTVLGMAKDSVELLQSAINYLTST